MVEGLENYPPDRSLRVLGVDIVSFERHAVLADRITYVIGG
jgi:hypothetical protein